jgi:competence ComEA-like helix-hairpin-helix protein
MSAYTRHQLTLLLIVLAVAGLGLAAGAWRRAHPELVERIERLERVDPERPTAADGSSGAPSPVRMRAGKIATPGATVPTLPDPVAGTDAVERRLDVNTATVAELVRLPGVGPVLAARIVEAREGGAFTSVDDLRRVPGVGHSKLERFRGLITVGEGDR